MTPAAKATIAPLAENQLLGQGHASKQSSCKWLESNRCKYIKTYKDKHVLFGGLVVFMFYHVLPMLMAIDTRTKGEIKQGNRYDQIHSHLMNLMNSYTFYKTQAAERMSFEAFRSYEVQSQQNCFTAKWQSKSPLSQVCLGKKSSRNESLTDGFQKTTVPDYTLKKLIWILLVNR